MSKDIIICLIGQSGSGKTTIAKELEKIGYYILQSYTTREPRSENEWGHTFVDHYSPTDDIIAYTYFNGYHYWATKEQCLGKGYCFYIIDPAGVEFLKKKCTNILNFSIFLMVDSNIRLNRLIERDGLEKGINRFTSDINNFNCSLTDYVLDCNIGTPAMIAKRISKLLPVID
jgi:guanylate kinase